jgi:hypothetical protein
MQIGYHSIYKHKQPEQPERGYRSVTAHRIFQRNELGDGQAMQKGRHGREITTGGVYIERNDRHCVIYRGTREALIAAGLAKSTNFPDGKKRLSWWYPKSGENWGIRRKNGELYWLTKLKDARGTIDAEIEAFKQAAAAQARGDSQFQQFMARMRCGTERAKAADDRLTGGTSCSDMSREAKKPRLPARVPEQNSALERVAVATLLLGLTVYFWTRQG